MEATLTIFAGTQQRLLINLQWNKDQLSDAGLQSIEIVVHKQLKPFY